MTIIGGGDSVAAVEKAGLADKMSYISTEESSRALEGKVLLVWQPRRELGAGLTGLSRIDVVILMILIKLKIKTSSAYK